MDPDAINPGAASPGAPAAPEPLSPPPQAPQQAGDDRARGDELNLSEALQMIEALRCPGAYDHPVERVELLETHISWILLTGPYAYKIKKPVNLGFVDFSTRQRRHHFCNEELRLNRRLAPDLYLSVVPIHGPPGRAAFGPGAAGAAVIDHAVRMRQFPQADLLPAVLERDGLRGDQLDTLADDLVTFHANAAVADPEAPFGTPEAVLKPAQANLDVLGAAAAAPPVLNELQAWTTATATRLAPTFRRRRSEGRIREGHGDLHLGNMVLRAGRIEVFDCLEFSPSLRWIDGISDLAFLVMDLQQRGRSDLGLRVLARWLEASGDYDGLSCWRWYVVYRALVRAKVTALRLGQPGVAAREARALDHQLQGYLTLALETSRPRPTLLAITRGVSGSGKSWLARRLCRRAGWIHLRSDVERKRLFGLEGIALTEALPVSAYGSEVSERLYGQVLPQQARCILSAGLSVVVDATFLRRQQRLEFEGLAQELGAGFVILDCPVPQAVAMARLERRRRERSDPSDADLGVLRSQLACLEPLSEAERRASLECALAGDPEDETAVGAILDALRSRF